MKKSIKILHIFGRMTAGGAEMRTMDIMRNIDRDKFQMDFCALSGESGELEEEITLLGGHTHHCKLNWGFNNRFLKLLREGQYDVVHSHVHLFSGYILWLAAKARVCHRIAHFRSMTDGKPDSIKRNIQRIIMKLLIDKYATKILAVSNGTMSSVWGNSWTSDARCQVIYNGIDPQRFDIKVDQKSVRDEFNFPRECRLLIHVGNFTPAKNHLRIINIFSQLQEIEPDWRLMLVGQNNNDIGRSVKKSIDKLDISDKVVMAGSRTDVGRLLKAADVMIFPSKWEGLPGAVLEGCATGVRIIASDLPGIREIAEYFSNIRLLSLEQIDTYWIDAILESAKKDNRYIVSFLNSPFYIKKVIKEIEDIWMNQ